MKRVMIIGQPGSGKSTLAVRLGECTGLPVFHMDRIHFISDWKPRDLDGKKAMTDDVHALDEWIFEGGFSRSWPDRLARADTLIWLDVPLLRRFWRVLVRTIKYRGRTRPDLPEGCEERLNGESLKFWKWIWDTRQTGRNAMRQTFENAPAEKSTFRLTTFGEVDEFLDQFKSR